MKQKKKWKVEKTTLKGLTYSYTVNCMGLGNRAAFTQVKSQGLYINYDWVTWHYIKCYLNANSELNGYDPCAQGMRSEANN